MKENYCFRTVAPDDAAVEAARVTIASARGVGLFKEFHVWSEASEIEGAVCHPLGKWNPRGRALSLHRSARRSGRAAVRALSVARSGDGVSASSGQRPAGAARAPVHVPLGFDLAALAIAREPWGGAPCEEIARQMRAAGVIGRLVVAAYSGFFIVHREAVETFHRLAFEFWHQCEAAGLSLSCEPLLAYAVQMLTGDPRRHHLSHSPELWLPRAMEEERPELRSAMLGPA